MLGPEYLRKCPMCQEWPSWNSRWRIDGSKPPELIYLWVACDHVPPCHIGPCYKNQVMAALGWNTQIKREERRYRKWRR